jgi:rare lipoprotein A (peptidoglycan hydrolase)
MAKKHHEPKIEWLKDLPATGSGKVSYYGVHDEFNNGKTASSVSPYTPGIAMPCTATLGHNFWVTMPNGRSAILPQTDVGPNPKLGRMMDVNEAALSKLGYSGGNFPTDQIVHWVDLGPGAHHQAAKAHTPASAHPAAAHGDMGHYKGHHHGNHRHHLEPHHPHHADHPATTHKTHKPRHHSGHAATAHKTHKPHMNPAHLHHPG